MDDENKKNEGSALRAMLEDAGRLYPEERLELVELLGCVERLRAVEADAMALLAALPEDLSSLKVSGAGPLGNAEAAGALGAFARRRGVS